MTLVGGEHPVGMAGTAVGNAGLDDDRLFSPAILRGHRLLGRPTPADDLLLSWRAGVTR